MGSKYTEDDLMKMDQKELCVIVLSLQDQIHTLNENFENLVEQLRIANQNRFGRRSEKLDVIDGQLSLFDEAEALSDPEVPEPEAEEVVKSYKRKRPKGKREEGLKGFPVKTIPHNVTEEELNEFYGVGNWKGLPDEKYMRLRYEPAK